MNNCINKEVDSFIAEIRKNMLCPTSQKKAIINDFENSIFDFVEANNITDISDVYAHFGEPKDIAQQLLEDLDPQKIKKAISVKKVITFTAISVVIAFIIFLLTSFIDAHKARYGIIENNFDTISLQILNFIQQWRQN